MNSPKPFTEVSSTLVFFKFQLLCVFEMLGRLLHLIKPDQHMDLWTQILDVQTASLQTNVSKMCSSFQVCSLAYRLF